MKSVEIRSYRNVFDLERRIYRIDRLRLNPAGVPVSGVIYFLALLTAILLSGHLPLIGMLVETLPWYLRDLLVPLVGAGVFAVVRIEGRPAHLALRALLRSSISPRRLAAFRPCPRPGQRWHPNRILLLPDGSEARLRRLSYTGPGAVHVARECKCTEGGSGLLARFGRRPQLVLADSFGDGRPARAQVIALRAGVRLRVR